MKKIVVRSKNNVVTVETFGYTGPSCKEADEFLRRALGDEIAETLKPVYYMGEEVEEEKICMRPDFCG